MDETEEDVEEKGGYKLNKKGFRLEKEKKEKQVLHHCLSYSRS